MIKLLFFGVLADKVGKQSMQAEAGQRLQDLIAAAGCADMQPLLVAVNQEQVHDLAYIVKDGDEVALMPPFAGG